MSATSPMLAADLHSPVVDAALTTAAEMLGMEVVFIGSLDDRDFAFVRVHGAEARLNRQQAHLRKWHRSRGRTTGPGPPHHARAGCASPARRRAPPSGVRRRSQAAVSA